MILRTDILDYQDSPPGVACRFWWSEQRGVTCDNVAIFAWLAAGGILVSAENGPGVRAVHLRDGREFFDALPVHFTGLMRAQPAVEDSHQGGEA